MSNDCGLFQIIYIQVNMTLVGATYKYNTNDLNLLFKTKLYQT